MVTITEPSIGDEVFSFTLPAERPTVASVTIRRRGTWVTMRFPDGEYVTMPAKYLGITPGGQP